MSSEEIASIKEFGREYDAAARSEDWEATYGMLDESAQQEFTEEEWVEIQQAQRDAEGSPAPLESVTVTQEDEEMTDVPVTVTLHYEDGTEEAMTAGMPMAVESGEDVGPRRYLTEEEISELEQLPTPDSTSLDTDELEAEARNAAQNYYHAAGSQNWSYTYEHLDSETQDMFTEDEWAQKNQYYWDRDPTGYEILSVEQISNSEESVVEVRVRIRGVDGSSFDRTTYWVLENGEWLHRFSQEEIESFMPGVSFEEFVARQ